MKHDAMSHDAPTVNSRGDGNARAAGCDDDPRLNRCGPRWGSLLAISSGGDTTSRAANGVRTAARAASTGWCPQLIDLDVDAKDKHELFRIAAEMLRRAHHVDPAPILRALWRREEAGSTGLGLGVAIPHARVPGIVEPLTMLLRMRMPILFDAPDGKPVSLALVIIVPADDATERHLQMLAEIAGRCTDREFRARLARAVNASDVRRAFADVDNTGAGAPSAHRARGWAA